MLTGPNVALANRMVQAQVLKPFRIRQDGKTRDTKVGEVVEVELWLANQLAKHAEPKIGPVTKAGREAQRAAA